jgi:SAM-dependent methyltransferase
MNNLVVLLPGDNYVAIERKTVFDLANTLTQRFLFDQIFRMKEAYPHSIVLIEGYMGLLRKFRRITPESLSGALFTLAQAGWQVTGVDFAPRAIRMAKRKTKKAGIRAELYVRDVTDLKGISGPFDLALDIGCFHSLGDKKAGYLSELERILERSLHDFVRFIWHAVLEVAAAK